MVISGGGLRYGLRGIDRLSIGSPCAHIRGFCKRSPQRARNLLLVRAEAGAGGNKKKLAKGDSAKSNDSAENALKTKGKQQKKRPAKRGAARASGTEEEKDAALSAEEQAKKKAREEAVKAERFGIDEKEPAPQDTAEAPLNVDDFNPVVLGRKSRKLLDDVWKQFTKLSSPVTSSMALDMDFRSASYEVGEFDTPQADNTTVLVIGGTGRVGRVLVRKLVLRGYDVVVLARDAEEVAQNLPSAVRVVQGDLTAYEACANAVKGVDKVIYCAKSGSAELADIKAVEFNGVFRFAKQLQNERHKEAAKTGQRSPSSKVKLAKGRNFLAKWQVEGQKQEEEEEVGLAAAIMKKKRSIYTPASRDTASVEVNERGNLVFSGKVFSAGGSVQVGTDLEVGDGLGNCEGLHIRVFGDGQTYNVQVSHDTGEAYAARLVTRVNKFVNFRLPFSAFRYSSGGSGPAPLEPARITHLSIRYENKPKTMPAVVRPGDEWLPFSDSAAQSFSLEIDRIKALPGGEEADFILVSCAGVAEVKPGGEKQGYEGGGDASGAQMLSMKRQGEEALRLSGLGYTIVRPGPLLEEPGGYKALVFDQGISCADVADVCLKALHDPAARNKTFEVCHEYTPEKGLQQYELVAHLPDKANNYLGPALAVLEKNT